jgi:hypothetical protein
VPHERLPHFDFEERLPGEERCRAASWRCPDTVAANGEFQMTAATAKKIWDTNFLNVTNFVPQKSEALAERFGAVITQFPVKQITRICDCSPETVKAWRSGRSVAYAPHLFKLARSIPSVNLWVRDEIDPIGINGRIAQLQQQALMPGEEGAAARAALNNIMAVARGEL